MILSEKKILLSLTVILLLFSALRDITFLYYIFIFFLISYFFLNNISKFVFFKKNTLPFIILFYFTIFLCIWSFVFSESIVSHTLGSGEIVNKKVSINPIEGIPRLLLMPIISFIFFSTLKSEEEFRMVLKVIISCFLIACFMVFAQSIFGSFSWLADTHLRGGYVRYASPLGSSLTILGSVVAYILIWGLDNNIIKNNLLKLLIFLIVIAATALSLTKTALVLLFLSILVILIIALIKEFQLFLKLISVLLFFSSIALIIILNNDYYLNYTNTVFNFTFGWTPFLSADHLINDTPNVTIDYLIYRLTWFSQASIDYFGIKALVLGVGVWGGGGVMGFPNEATSHSGIFDLLLVGGIIYLLLFLFIFIKSQYYFYKHINYNLNKFFFVCNIIFFANMIFISGSYFHPAISIIFWLSLPYYFYQKDINKIQS